ncbi:NADPH-dependent FMN reductase [Chitinophaga sp. MM2321]|uniref:NADPH-dependent FMN reductase n=1 Tax=Chitinophaga sp. MM2321 TaxID=3137178 RepID=UPI0032D5AFEC
MNSKINILAISGSTRTQSSNLNLIKAFADQASDVFTVHIFEGLSDIPHFNPDLDNENPPEQVAAFRRQLNAADGILICTPEYAIGVPGTLKNAIDWTVSSMEFSKKPVALITASTSGMKGHQSLLGTLLIIEAKMTAATQLVISGIKTKVNNDCKITDTNTLNSVQQLIQSLAALVKDEPVRLLPAPTLF